MSLSSDAREERLVRDYTNKNIISGSKYNLIMGLTVLYGLAVNSLLCYFVKDIDMYISPKLFLIIYLICAVAGATISAKSDNPIISFLGYNLIVVPVGLMLTSSVHYYLEINPTIVFSAFLYTAIMTTVMIAFAVIKPRAFSGLGRTLFFSLIALIICELFLVLIGVQQIITSWITAIIFTIYIGYDFYRSQQFPKTVDNAIDCAIDIYLDIINLFVRIMDILSDNK